MLHQPRIERMPDMRQHRRRRLQFFNALQSQVQVVVISRGLGLWWHRAVEHQQVQRLTLQKRRGVRWQTDGVGQVGDTPTFAFQQVAEGRFGMQ
ncbi:hypothetical protein D3C87_1737620 [compost metagenome]